MFATILGLIALAAPGSDGFLKIEQFIASGDYRAALAALEQMPQPQATTARWHLLASKAHDGLNDPAHAVAEAQAAIDLEPLNEAHHLQLAQIFLTHHTPEPALEILTDARRLFPDSILVRLGLGLALKELQRNQDAAKILLECLERKPDLGLAFETLGTVYLDSGRYDELLEAANHYRERNPADYRGYYYAAAALAAMRADVSGAEELIRRAIRLKPDFAASHALLGKILLERDQAAAAVPALEEAIRLRPDYSPAHLYLANAYRKLDRSEEAAREFAQVRSLKERERQPPLSLEYHRGRRPSRETQK